MTDGAMGGSGDGAIHPPADPGAMDAASAAPPDAGEVAPSPHRPVAPSEVLSWLDARANAPPAELRDRMGEALAAVSSETVPGALAEAALSCMKDTLAAPEERASALDLLAADALLTYALEAAAELGAEMLRDITSEYGPEKLSTLLPRDEAT